MVHVVNDIEISPDRLMRRLDELAEIGAITGPRGHAGSSRLALTDDDRRGRDLVMTWMRDLGLDITVDAIGNVVGQMPSDSGLAPVMCGSHIDTVGTGGRFDGNLGVLAGLEVIESVMSAGVQLPRPLAVAFFTDEEGARFPPDMLGSLVYAGGMALEAAQSIVAVDGTGATVGSELERIGYLGAAPCPGPAPHAFVELHIEQGPVLEQMGRRVGAVTGVQGISWTAVELRGVSNHAGTTPMSMRCDPMFVVGHMTAFLRSVATEIGAPQVATVGRVELHPNLINVIPASATFTIDVRHTDDKMLREVEQRVDDELRRVAAD
jgi:N-carbamoyl-L-amino-acid hydrolase